MNRHLLRALAVLVALTAVVTAGAPNLLRIHRGDTLWQIARDHHTTVARLMALNHLPGNGLILAGQMLLLPGTARPTTTPATTSMTRRTTTVGYVVRPGDNLTVLAHRFGTTPRALAARNHLRGDLIVIGQRLTYRATRVVRSGSGVVPAGSGVAGSVAASVAGSVAASAAAHRAELATRPVPSQDAVRGLIRQAAQRNHVDPSLALAVAYQESGFQQRVVSPVDAIGVMQVLPSTGRALSLAYGRSFDLMQARDNVDAGVLLLRELLASTRSQSGALAGYYQGLGSIAVQGLLPQTHSYIRNITFLQRRFR